jgi:hypothetical protein
VALYVLALTDEPVEPMAVGGRRLHTESIAGVHVVCERRRAAPPASEPELRAQHAIVLEIASYVRAILPVRFGTLVTKAGLGRIVRAHQAEIRAGLDLVRDRVQMTIRVTGRRPAAGPSPLPATGRAYLAAKQRQAFPRLPAPATALLKALAPLVAAERRAPGAGALLATVYHLVNAADLGRYARLARRPPRSITVTGPWPPFAFTPQLA